MLKDMGLNIDKFTRAGLEPRTSGLASQTFYPVTFYVACHRLDFVNVMQIFILFFYPLHQFVLALYTYTPEFCEKKSKAYYSDGIQTYATTFADM